MAPLSLLQQRVRTRKDTSDDEIISEPDVSELENLSGTDRSELGTGDDGATEEDSSASSPPADNPFSLSFGALARAQDTLGKRKHPSQGDNDNSSSKRARIQKLQHPIEQSHNAKSALRPTRTSKHAPQALSSKRAVTRHRSVIDVPKVAPRDPRFDPLAGPVDDNRIKQNYDFLSSYRSSEISQLKSAIRASRTADEKEKLQKALRRMESRRQVEEAKEREQKVIREHRKEEKVKVQEGKKPFYLKEGEVKKRALVARFEGMGDKKRERIVGRKQKKQAGKEKKMIPERRSVIRS